MKLLFARACVYALLASLAGGAGFVRADDVFVEAPEPLVAAVDPAKQLGLLPPGTRGTLVDEVEEWTERVPSPSSPLRTTDFWQVEYTVSPKLDRRVRELLANDQVPLGHVIVMDPHTGEVFSYVSTDPETFPATRTYPTASLMKVVTAAAVLRSKPDAAAKQCRYAGSPYVLQSLTPPEQGGDANTFERALAISNNQCFAQLAVNELGEETLVEEIRRSGLLEPPATNHPAGFLEPIRDDFALGELGSGLAGSFISPLGAARLASVLAEGELVEPHWIARIRDGRGHDVDLPERNARPVWPRPLTERLRELMTSVTESGTARGAFHDAEGAPRLGPVRVSGKTGTLSGTDPEGRYQWFIGVAPADDPKIAIATVVVHGQSPTNAGAAEVAAQTLETIFCESGTCDPAGADWLHTRARERREAIAEARELQAVAHEQRQALSDAFAGAIHAAAATHAWQQQPRPLGSPKLRIPARLRGRQLHGEIVLELTLSPTGDVLALSIAESDLPELEASIAQQVRGWKFSPPLRNGAPAQVTARLPIPIHIQ